MTETTTQAPARRIPYMIGDPSKPTARVSLLMNAHWRSFALASDQGKKLVELLRADPQDADAIAQAAHVPTWIAMQTHGRVTVDDCERLRLDGEIVDYGLGGRIAKIIQQGQSFEAIANYIERAAKNPNQDAAQRTYVFLEKGDMPITPEGMIVLFKRVDQDYRSFWSGKEPVNIRYADGREEVVTGRIPHPIGGEIWMPREMCDPNSAVACSVGIHGCSFEYLRKYHSGSGKIVIGLVDPADVTAIPQDSYAHDEKLRCCRMQIVGEIDEAEAREHFKDAVDQRYPPIQAEPQATGDDALELTDVVDPQTALEEMGRESQRLKLYRPEDAVDVEPVNLDPAFWSQRGYAEGKEAGEDDRTNDYDYKPEFEVPAVVAEEEAARAAYAKAFVEAYDGAYRATPAPPPADVVEDVEEEAED